MATLYENRGRVYNLNDGGVRISSNGIEFTVLSPGDVEINKNGFDNSLKEAYNKQIKEYEKNLSICDNTATKKGVIETWISIQDKIIQEITSKELCYYEKIPTKQLKLQCAAMCKAYLKNKLIEIDTTPGVANVVNNDIEKIPDIEPNTNPDKIDIDFDTVKDIDFAHAVYFVFKDTLNSIKPDKFTTLLKNKAIINITGKHSDKNERDFRNRKYETLKRNLKKIIKEKKSSNKETVKDLINRLEPYKNILE